METTASVRGHVGSDLEPVKSCVNCDTMDGNPDATNAAWKETLPSKWLSPKPVRWIRKLKAGLTHEDVFTGRLVIEVLKLDNHINGNTIAK